MNESFTEKYFKSYESTLGDILFPGENFFDLEARTFIGELLASANGEIRSPQEFLRQLDTFTPEIIRDAIENPTWATERTVSRWETMTKSMIRQKMLIQFSAELQK